MNYEEKDAQDSISREVERESSERVDDEKVDELEVFWNNISEEDLESLQEKFNSELEYGGIPITKDNCEELFDVWAEKLTLAEIKSIIF